MPLNKESKPNQIQNIGCCTYILIRIILWVDIKIDLSFSTDSVNDKIPSVLTYSYEMDIKKFPEEIVDEIQNHP